MANLIEIKKLKPYLLIFLLVAIYLLGKNINSLSVQYFSFYRNNRIGSRLTQDLQYISAVNDESYYIPGGEYTLRRPKNVTIGDTAFETQNLRHYTIVTLDDDYLAIESIKSQCLFDLPLLRPSMKSELKNTILLCDMMQRFIISYRPENPGNLEDYKNMVSLMREYLFIWFDKTGTYLPDIKRLGDSSRSTRGNYNFKHKNYYSLKDIELKFQRFNAFVEGDGAQLFSGLLEKYSPQ